MGEGLEIELSTPRQCNPHKYSKQWDSESLQVGEYIHMPGEWHTPNYTGTEAPVLSTLLTSIYALLHLTVHLYPL